MKKNSFTLIELLAVLILIGVISLIAVPSILKVINNTNTLASETQIAAIKEAALNYSIKNDLENYNNIEKVLSFDDLVNGGFITEKDIKSKSGSRLPGCVIYKWLDNSKQYSFRYDAECNPVAPTIQITFNPLNDPFNSDNWANHEFYVNVDVTNSNGYKWCSTTLDSCVPTSEITETSNSVLITSNSLTNKICVQAKNLYDEYEKIECSENYKLDSSLPNIAYNSEGYVVVTPSTSINVIDYFDYSSNGVSNIKSTSCKNKTSDQAITETSNLAIGDYDMECTVTTESGVSNSANMALSIDNCFSYDGNVINDYYCYVGNNGGYKEISDVIIPYRINKNNVNFINYNAFNNNQLTSVIIPNSIIGIGYQAFTHNKITNVTIPNSVTKIDEGVFADNQITSVTIPNSVISIGDGAFQANQITNVTIPNSVTSIGRSAFRENQLINVIIPNSVTSIGDGAFQANQITSVTIPNSVTSIGKYAFQANQLTNVTIPNSVTSIGENTFESNQLIDVIIPNNVTSIGGYAFQANQLTSVTIGNSVTSISHGAFQANQLTSVTIPNSVTTMNSHVFSNNQLTSLTLGTGLISIGSGVFYNNQLTSVTIPNSVTSIGSGAFKLNKLASVTIGNNVADIGTYAFQANQLTSVTIPDSVTSIGVYAFQANKLTNVTIGNSVTSISNGTFSDNQLTNLTIPNSVTTIGSTAFYGNQLATVTLGTGLTSIGYGAFYKLSSNNPITTIYNNSGKPFDWTSITSSSTAGQTFVTGTITHQDGNITVTTN